jgi:hypothetical protein
MRADELVDEVSMLGNRGGCGGRRGRIHANWMSRASRGAVQAEREWAFLSHVDDTSGGAGLNSNFWRIRSHCVREEVPIRGR